LALFLAGCGTVKPEGDYRKAAALITKHTGVKEVYDPAVDPLIEKKVEDLLQDGLHLDEAIQVALLNNRSFQSSFLDIGVSRADVVQSGMLANPVVSLLPRIPDIGGRADLTTSFVQELSALWQMPIAKKTALNQLENTVLKVGDAAVTLAAQVKTQYCGLVTLGESERIERENGVLVDQSMVLAQHRFDAGETTLLDVNLVKSDVVAARMRLSKVQGNIEAARASFAKLLGIDKSNTFWELVDPVEAPKQEIPDNNALIELAMSQRLDAQMGAMEVRLAENELAKQGRSVISHLSLGVESERFDSSAGPSRSQRGFAAWHPLTEARPTFPNPAEDKLAAKYTANSITGPSLETNLPLFDQNRAQMAKARIKLQQKRKVQEEVEAAVREDVEKAAVGVRKAAEQLRASAEEALPLAERNYETAQRVYKAGEDSILIVIEAHKTLIAARNDRNQALGDGAAAMAELERAVGGRLDVGAGDHP
jgi:cobalt-zinc-cadmium efflux system outer membrane protein